jgi:four helix bundle protein
MASKITDLECWRLADELRAEVHAICAQERVAERRKFCDGFTEAAGSVCRNISEGFGRFDSGYIVQFFGYALASLSEAEDYLRECQMRHFIDKARFDADLELLEHTRAKTLRFKQYHERKQKASRSSSRARRSTRSDGRT